GLRAGVDFFEESPKILTQPDQARFASFLGPLAHRALDQPRAVSIEILDAMDIDRDSARRDSARGCLNLGLDCAGIFGNPRSGSGGVRPGRLVLAGSENSLRPPHLSPAHGAALRGGAAAGAMGGDRPGWVGGGLRGETPRRSADDCRISRAALSAISPRPVSI